MDLEKGLLCRHPNSSRHPSKISRYQLQDPKSVSADVSCALALSVFTLIPPVTQKVGDLCLCMRIIVSRMLRSLSTPSSASAHSRGASVIGGL
jgi:hypothetical protein